MSIGAIRKSLLKNHRFGDHPSAWIIEARGFRYSAQLLLQSLRSQRSSEFISIDESSVTQSCNKTICYLFSVAIELFLKALYSNSKSPSDQKKTESFGHDIKKLNLELMHKNILQKNELDDNTLELAYIILAWHGRYHKPRSDKTDNTIELYFEEIPDQPELVKPKFNITTESVTKLELMATLLFNKTNVNLPFMDLLFFTPF
jgi:hypothetical protein